MAGFLTRTNVLANTCRLSARSLFVSTRNTQSAPAEEKPVIKNVTIIGAGLMGAGIAQVAAQNDFNVVLVDEEDEYLQKAEVTIRKSLDRVTKKKFPDEPKGSSKFVDDTMSKIKRQLYPGKGVENADLVIEAITENMAAKHKLFKEIDAAAPASCIFASNTSSLSITEIGSVTGREDKFGGLHFFNPVPVMKLIEVRQTK